VVSAGVTGCGVVVAGVFAVLSVSIWARSRWHAPNPSASRPTDNAVAHAGTLPRPSLVLLLRTFFLLWSANAGVRTGIGQQA
jgi:hypothetical protein